MQVIPTDSNLLQNIVPSLRWCESCCCYHERIDAELPDGTRVMVQSVDSSFLVYVGEIPAPGLFIVPISDSEVIPEIMRQWSEVQS